MFIKHKKSLGQNFLIDRNVLEQIVATVQIINKEVLEIGPGSGNLTTYILKNKPKKMYVIEKDNDLSLLLREKFNDSITVMNDDVLKVIENERQFEVKTGGPVNQCWGWVIKSCFDEAVGRVNLGNKKLFRGPLFVKNVLAKMPLDN